MNFFKRSFAPGKWNVSWSFRIKVWALRRYIVSRIRDRDEDAWQGYSAAISNMLMQYTEKDFEHLQLVMQHWEDEVVFQLASPMLYIHSNNFSYSDRIACYARIFLQVKQPEIEWDLLRNIHLVVHIQRSKQSLDFYTGIQAKILRLAGENYPYLSFIDAKVEGERLRRTYVPPKELRTIHSMYFLPAAADDKVKKLHDYILKNLDDYEGDSWIYFHEPLIVDHINGFSLAECERLAVEMWNWPEAVFSCLADPLGETGNKFIDGNAIYCDIFLKVTDRDELDYLIDNVPASIGLIFPGTRTKEYYESLKEKLRNMHESVAGIGEHPYIQYVDEKMLKEFGER